MANALLCPSRRILTRSRPAVRHGPGPFTFKSRFRQIEGSCRTGPLTVEVDCLAPTCCGEETEVGVFLVRRGIVPSTGRAPTHDIRAVSQTFDKSGHCVRPNMHAIAFRCDAIGR
jgi:hypothetical protein